MDALGHEREGVSFVPAFRVRQADGVLLHEDVPFLVRREVVGWVEELVRRESFGGLAVKELEGPLVVQSLVEEAEYERPPGGGEGELFFFGVRSVHDNCSRKPTNSWEELSQSFW